MNEKATDVLAKMDQLGVQAVRDMVLSGQWPANYSALAAAWLHQKDSEERERKDAHKADAIFVAQRSNERAHAAEYAASAAKKLAEDASVIAREANSVALASVERSAVAIARNNLIAKAALIAALIAIVISIISLFLK
jgi:hypothetical protein